MYNLIDLLAKTDENTVALDICGESTIFIFQIARWIIRIIQIAVPFALILWGSIDFFKAVIAGDEKEMKVKRKPFISRLVAAVVILLMPTIVNLIIDTVGKNVDAVSDDKSSFSYCWSQAGENIGQITLPSGNSDVN